MSELHWRESNGADLYFFSVQDNFTMFRLQNLSGGLSKEGCSGCQSLSFPDFTSISHMEPLWLPPPFCCPLLSVPSDSELEAVLGFLSSWRVTSVHRWDKKMTIFLLFFHPTLFSGERLREEGNYYMLGEPGPGDAAATPAWPVGEEEDLDLRLDEEKPEISGNAEEWPKKNFRSASTILIPDLSESVSHNDLSLLPGWWGIPKGPQTQASMCEPVKRREQTHRSSFRVKPHVRL